jgi:hypothetical protein
VFAVLRVAAVLFAIALGACALAWLVTGDPRWRHRTWLVFKYAVFALALLLALFAGEALLE